MDHGNKDLRTEYVYYDSPKNLFVSLKIFNACFRKLPFHFGHIFVEEALDKLNRF